MYAGRDGCGLKVDFSKYAQEAGAKTDTSGHGEDVKEYVSPVEDANVSTDRIQNQDLKMIVNRLQQQVQPSLATQTFARPWHEGCQSKVADRHDSCKGACMGVRNSTYLRAVCCRTLLHKASRFISVEGFFPTNRAPCTIAS